MIVTIAGCGALGGVIAAHLLEGGLQVQAFQRKGKTLDALKEKGVTILSEDRKSSNSYPLTAVSDAISELLPTELIIVLVKSYDTESLLPLRGLLLQGGAVLTLQNGLGNAETLSDIFGESKVAAGITTYGGVTLSPGVVMEGLKGSITFGPWSGEGMEWIAETLGKAGLRIDHVRDPKPLLWKKLCMNAMANPVFALTGIPVRDISRNTFALDLMEHLGKEVVEAAARSGVILDFDENWKFLMDHSKKASDHKPSMLQDIEAGRRMEVQGILGGILAYAGDEKEFPYTRSLYDLLMAIDSSRGNYQ
ncbi:MAG: 2-dehydropantoate 2-reductase [Synergistales bacterium]|nr:2-dehydropantoate 2-reductase [Synergistales bacterium]